MYIIINILFVASITYTLLCYPNMHVFEPTFLENIIKTHPYPNMDRHVTKPNTT